MLAKRGTRSVFWLRLPFTARPGWESFDRASTNRPQQHRLQHHRSSEAPETTWMAIAPAPPGRR